MVVFEKNFKGCFMIDDNRVDGDWVDGWKFNM